MNSKSLIDIITANNKLAQDLSGAPEYSVAILSNIITSQLNPIFEYALRSNNINAKAVSGNYDNIIQDSRKFAENNAVIIFWELANLVDGLQYKINHYDTDTYNSLFNKIKTEIAMVVDALKNTPLVIFNEFTCSPFTETYTETTHIELFTSELNSYLRSVISPNIKLVNIRRLLLKTGISNAIDLRNYYAAKSLYNVNFYKEYVKAVLPVFLSVNGKSKKALIFDCDNTLWQGILGEDGFDKIKMSAKYKEGAVFEEVQYLALDLKKKGILIGLCSKNNADDVNRVIAQHPDMVLRDDDITIKKINWLPKSENIINISKELNIGLDSLVFIDDSDFEVNLIREQVPEVAVFQVPKMISLYPSMIREISNLFYNVSQTKEDIERIDLYKSQVKREASRETFSNLEEYLKSLEIKVTVYEDEPSYIPRMSQMTQKTNQFNLTTKRYTETEIRNFTDSDNYTLLAIDVTDKFGDNGITGLAIIQHAGNEAVIDTFLMSCRIIGRNIEFKFFEIIIGKLLEKNISVLKAMYSPTSKNSQVENFYENAGMELEGIDNGTKKYIAELNTLNNKTSKVKYINIQYGK